MFPRELYCAHCATSLSEASETVLLPGQGSRLAMAGGLLLDLLGVVLVVGAQFWTLPSLVSLLLGIVIGLLYRTFSRTRGRQSFGQAVFHQLTVSRDAGPAGYGAAAKRTVGELVFLPWSALRGATALGKLDDFSDSYEVTLV